MTDLVPDKLNEQPTAFFGLTQKEMIRLAVKCLGGCFAAGLLLGLLSGVVLLVSVFVGLGVMIGAGLTFLLAKYVIAPRKAGTPFGYHDQKARVYGLWARLGLRRQYTLHHTRLWCHKKH